HCMTLTFSLLLAFIFIIELGAGIAAYILQSEVRHIIEVNMEKGLQNYETHGHEGVTKTWNIVQHEVMGGLGFFFRYGIYLNSTYPV
ncbi:Tetraspanin, partial [Caligus rogercresseyi]